MVQGDVGVLESVGQRGTVFGFMRDGGRLFGKRFDGLGRYYVELFPSALGVGGFSRWYAEWEVVLKEMSIDSSILEDKVKVFEAMGGWDLVIIPRGAFCSLDALNGWDRKDARYEGVSLNLFGEVVKYWGVACGGVVEELNQAEQRYLLMAHAHHCKVFDDGVLVDSVKTLIFEEDEAWENFLGFLRNHIADISEEVLRVSELEGLDWDWECGKYPLVYPRTDRVRSLMMFAC